MNTRILVVDDNCDAANTLAMLIKAFGYQAKAVYDGRQAVEEAARCRPAMVLVDLGMPDLNGYEAVVRIREQSGQDYVIAVAVTGWTREEHKGRAWDCGFDLYVTKPMSLETLRELLSLLNPTAPVRPCDGLDEADLRQFKTLLYENRTVPTDAAAFSAG